MSEIADVDARTHLETWRKQQAVEQSRTFAVMTIPVNVTIAIASRFPPEEMWRNGFLAFALAWGLYFGLVLVLDRMGRLPRAYPHRVAPMVMAALLVLLLAAFAYSSRRIYADEAIRTLEDFKVVHLTWNPLLRSMATEAGALMMLVCTGGVSLILLPIRGWSLLAAVAFQFVVAVATFVFVGHSPTWILVQALALFVGGIIAWRMNKLQDRIAGLEFEKIGLIKREIAAKYERELELAKEIQTSALPPRHMQVGKQTSIECFQMTHHKVGGDWMAVREMRDGRIIVLVADATGKGIQAALVVHAVQSLWARTLGGDEFDAVAFLQEVNTTLKHMGQQKAHTMTMGIAEITVDRVRYFSAGHPQLYLMEGRRGDAPQVGKRLHSVGNFLGMGLKLSLRVKELPLPTDRPVQIVVASDGIYDGLARPHEVSIGILLHAIATVGPHAIEMLPSEDDKTLVIVRREPL